MLVCTAAKIVRGINCTEHTAEIQKGGVMY
jgi:hypothetical protein